MTQVLKEWFVKWATEECLKIEAVIVIGSHGRGEASHSSDIDIICVVDQQVDINTIILAVKASLGHSFDLKLCYPKYDKENNNKLLAIVVVEGQVVRLDIFVVSSIESVKRYIIGSELSLTNIKDILLYRSANTNGTEIEMRLRDIIKNYCPEELNNESQYLKYLVTSFIEAFEVASNKRAQSDKFQFFYQMNLAYVALVKLESFRIGNRKFLYLPKQIFSNFDESIRAHFEFKLEPRGYLKEGLSLQEKYLLQFKATLEGLVMRETSIDNKRITASEKLTIVEELVVVEDIAAVMEKRKNIDQGKNLISFLQDIGPLHLIVESLQMILNRDKFYNFRDVGESPKGSIKTGILYRSGFFSIERLIAEKEIKTVIDLRTVEEGSLQTTSLPTEILHIKFDLLGCSEPTDGKIKYTNCYIPSYLIDVLLCLKSTFTN